MRGELSIRSARAPYRRAGLAWAGRDPVVLHLRALDGERLFALLHDPVLTVQVGQDDGSFQPVPAIDRELTAEQLQMLIDSAPVTEEPSMGRILDQAAFDAAAVQIVLHDAGVDDLAQLADLIADQRGELLVMTANLASANLQLGEASERLERLREALGVENAETALEAAQLLVADNVARGDFIGELRAAGAVLEQELSAAREEIAALKAAGAEGDAGGESKPSAKPKASTKAKLAEQS